MNIAVVGVGAIGGWLAARLALAGHEVTCVARGGTLTALRGEVVLLAEHHREAPANRIARDARAVDAAAHNQEISHYRHERVVPWNRVALQMISLAA